MKRLTHHCDSLTMTFGTEKPQLNLKQLLD